MSLLALNKQTCQMPNFVSVCFFLHIYVHFFYPISAFIYCNLQSGQIGPISLWLYSAPFNGSIVYRLDCSSSQIHALKMLHALAHPIRAYLLIQMGVKAPSWAGLGEQTHCCAILVNGHSFSE